MSDRKFKVGDRVRLVGGNVLGCVKHAYDHVQWPRGFVCDYWVEFHGFSKWCVGTDLEAA